MTFLHYAQSPDHQIYARELADVRRSGYGVDVHLLHPELGDPAFTPMWLERLVPGFREVPTWLCGPGPLVEAVREAYDGSDALQVEYFRPPATGGGAAGGLFHLMTGNLSHQIEHHLFPDLPARRYPQVSGEIRDLCERYDLPYNTGRLGGQLWSVAKKICRFALPGAPQASTDGERAGGEAVAA